MELFPLNRLTYLCLEIQNFLWKFGVVIMLAVRFAMSFKTGRLRFRLYELSCSIGTGINLGRTQNGQSNVAASRFRQPYLEGQTLMVVKVLEPLVLGHHHIVMVFLLTCLDRQIASFSKTLRGVFGPRKLLRSRRMAGGLSAYQMLMGRERRASWGIVQMEVHTVLIRLLAAQAFQRKAHGLLNTWEAVLFICATKNRLCAMNFLPHPLLLMSMVIQSLTRMTRMVGW
ncbi:hypothetical protein HY29_18015 [Hyphomonas beringensis]|uniref:Uncharacterized protein n=1 Tax=Hyphomonas beringensis TaxID=1280946 RepID=A0A062U242_9PROT|nr:hypothetical protein HY29_18015 [Hyphomonas beringensis]